MNKMFISLLLLCLNLPVFAKPVPVLIYSVMDLSNDSYLEQSNINRLHSIASLTKLMTAYVLIKNHPGIETCTSKITLEDRDLLKNTKTHIVKDETISCKKLLQAMLIMSDNWAASSLARSLPGKSSSQFIGLMNEQASKWGMKMTYFKDSSGLSPENLSTVKDLNILVKNVLSVNLIKNLSGQKDIVMMKENGDLDFFKNTNRLIRENNYEAILSKTGYIKESGYNLVFVPKNCKQKNIAIIVLGSISSIKRSDFAENIMGKYGCS